MVVTVKLPPGECEMLEANAAEVAAALKSIATAAGQLANVDVAKSTGECAAARRQRRQDIGTSTTTTLTTTMITTTTTAAATAEMPTATLASTSTTASHAAGTTPSPPPTTPATQSTGATPSLPPTTPVTPAVSIKTKPATTATTASTAEYDYKGEKVCWGDNGDIGAKGRGRGRESSPLAARDQPPPLVHRMPAHPRRAALCALHPRGPGS